VSRATGAYVICLNSDDLLLPNCLEIAGSALNDRRNVAAAYFSATYLVGSTVQGFHEIPDVSFADDKVFGENAWLEGYHGTSPTFCLFRKSAFDDIGGYRPTLRFAYDWDLYMRFMKQGGGVAFVPEVLCVYRRHSEQMVNDRAIDGVLDVLDLWRSPEYSHWSTSTIAHMVLTYCSNRVRNGGGFVPLFRELRRLELKGRIVSGLPAALFMKVKARIGGPATSPKHYRTPNNVESAMESARAILSDSRDVCSSLFI
jgi:hypothetical protein